jgi:hypothetical protein
VAGEGPKNTSKIKSRRRPNPRVASLYSILFEPRQSVVDTFRGKFSLANYGSERAGHL